MGRTAEVGTVSLHPTQRAREKILLAGPWGSGKSYARNRLIHTLNATDSESKVFILDTDDTHDRAVDAYGEDFLARVEWRYVNSYEDWKLAAEELVPKVGKDDWLVVDRIDLLWPAAQDHYIQEVFGVDSTEFFLTFAMGGGRGSPLAGDHGKNWDVIKRLYAQVVANLIFPKTEVKGKTYGHPGHVLACATVKDFNAENADEQAKLTYQRFGARPAGEKNLPSQFHSVLLLSAGPPWVMNTAREREGRGYVEGMVVNDWVLQYLVQTAGWRLDDGD